MHSAPEYPESGHLSLRAQLIEHREVLSRRKIELKLAISSSLPGFPFWCPAPHEKWGVAILLSTPHPYLMDKIAMLTGILSQHPTDAFTRYGLALAYSAEGRTEDALREFATALEHNPDYVPAYQMSAQTLLKLRRTEEAKQRLEAGLAAAARTHNAHAASEMQAMLDDLTL